jgi:phosphoglycerate dehydrogenase-like enzyme
VVNVTVHGQVSELGQQLLDQGLRPPSFMLSYVGPQDPHRRAILEQCEVLIVDHAPLAEADFVGMPRLRLVQRLGRGSYDISGEIAAARARGVPFAHNRSGFAARATAEHTVMMMLALPRRLPQTHEYVRVGNWRSTNRYDAATRELHGARIGLVGMGRIARHVARLLAPFGVSIAYWSRHALPADEEARLGVAYAPLPQLLAQSDVVSLHVRGNGAQDFLFGAQEFAAMRPGGYFINTSRGALVDEAALARALCEGHVAGAALDVFDREPLPPDAPLRDLPGVIMTPHIAGRTREVAEAYYLCAIANVYRLLRGEPLEDLATTEPGGGR